MVTGCLCLLSPSSTDDIVVVVVGKVHESGGGVKCRGELTSEQ